jgi:hypothetical protein
MLERVLGGERWQLKLEVNARLVMHANNLM